MVLINKLSLTVLLALIIHKQGESDAARILGLFPMQGKSHYVGPEALMRRLAARGHQVDVVSHFPLKDPPPNYRDISLAGTLPMIVNNLTLTDINGFVSAGYKNLFEYSGNQVCGLLDTPQMRNIIENPPTDPPYDVVICELFVADCYLAFGRHLNIPIVGIVVSKVYDWMNLPLGIPLNTAFVPSVFSHFNQRMTFVERLVNTLLSGLTKACHWYYVPAQLAFVEKFFGIKVSRIEEFYQDIAVVLVNTHPSFYFVRPLPPSIVEVGGLHVTDGHQDFSPEVKKWLDDSKDGCVYFSFGSMVKIESFPPETIKAFYGAFEGIAPVRVLMKIAKKDELPAGLPKNVMTSAWLPQTRVLQHKNVKAFVTHGGALSTQEAITYGVPMIDVPIFGDQYLNARLCEEKKIAVTVDYRKTNVDSFTKALNDVLKNHSYSENAKRFSKLWTDRPMSALDTAIFWVEYVIRNGNVLQSPANELTWWQIELLDVYAFILFAFLLTLYIVKRLVGRALGLLCYKSSATKGARTSRAPSKSKKNE